MDSIEGRIDLVDGAFWGRNPHEELAWLRANSPVWRDPRTGVWGVATYDLVRYVSTHPQEFSSAGGIRPDHPAQPMMIDMDDPAHWQRRKLVNKGFTPRRVREKEDSIRQIVDAILDDVCERGECDLVGDIAAWLPLIVIANELGVDPADRAQLLQWSEDMMGALGDLTDQTAQLAAAAGAQYYAYAQRIIDARRERPTEDLMSILVHAEVDGDRLQDRQIISESLLILNGGDETTRHVISGGVYELLRAPDAWEALRHDRTLIPAAVEEMLRWVSPIKNMARTATADVDLGGRRIPAGDTLLLLYPSANRDEAAFPQPFTFDIRRSPNEHVAFGFGAHYCLGTSLARLELHVILDRLLDRLPDLTLVDADEPKHRSANFVSGYENIPVRFTATRPVSTQEVLR
ncbi:cytochrome P450 [Frankia sp. AgKG'84/4]|uniref:cytochrome P450 n=1 Tax=Frankia sp. AgKG'84/4 TaxID=573490 RepID=UPI00200D5D60|nr:cytochrome P450 [Frankia sp. AgKG'84/4]MCL9793055.1 cytochrome P450 [Frankia sp. AgKG'84/4]